MIDMDRISAAVEAGSAHWLTDGQLQFARALFIATPPVVYEMPRGDRAILTHDGGTDMVLFVDGNMFCEILIMRDDQVKNLEAADAGALRYAGD